MCGIIACLNCKNQNTILLDGLNQLQNRGYDSCGISIIENGEFKTQKYSSNEKQQGLSKLKEKLILNNTNIGLAHTRWATHGKKNDINAHPHIDFHKKVCLVHNGIITNYKSIKERLIELGYEFYGETDTEVIANLISYNISKNDNIFKSIKTSIEELEGTWGLVIMTLDKPDSLYISKSGSPILLGKNEQEIIVSSEINALCNRCEQVISLDEGEILEISSNKINDNTGENSDFSKFFKNRELLKINTQLIKKTPYPFPHWMIKEIMEQPLAILKTLNYGARILNTKVTLGGLDHKMELISDKGELIILGCGTSLNAGLWSSYLLKKNKIFSIVKVIDASEFELYDITNPDETVVLVLSQSGETKDVHRCMNVIKNINIPIIGITNIVGSLIARETDCGIYLNAGREVSVASTKSFICQQVALVLFSLWFYQKNKKVDILFKTVQEELKYLPSMVENVLVNLEQYKNIAKILVKHNSCFLLGKNVYESIAREGALKLKEIGYIHAEAFPGGSLKHGPFSLIESGTPIILFIMDDIYREFMISTMEEVKSRGANVVIITDFNIKCEIDKELIIKIPRLEKIGSILSILPIQIISYEMALLKGHNPDYPRNLAKVVTVD